MAQQQQSGQQSADDIAAKYGGTASADDIAAKYGGKAQDAAPDTKEQKQKKQNDGTHPSYGNVFMDAVGGVGAGLYSTIKGAADLTGVSRLLPDSANQFLEYNSRPPESFTGKFAKNTEQAAEYAVPFYGEEKAELGAAKGVAGVAKRALVSGAKAGTVGAVQGGSGDSAVVPALTGAGLSAAGELAVPLVRAAAGKLPDSFLGRLVVRRIMGDASGNEALKVMRAFSGKKGKQTFQEIAFDFYKDNHGRLPSTAKEKITAIQEAEDFKKSLGRAAVEAKAKPYPLAPAPKYSATARFSPQQPPVRRVEPPVVPRTSATAQFAQAEAEQTPEEAAKIRALRTPPPVRFYDRPSAASTADAAPAAAAAAAGENGGSVESTQSSTTTGSGTGTGGAKLPHYTGQRVNQRVNNKAEAIKSFMDAHPEIIPKGAVADEKTIRRLIADDVLQHGKEKGILPKIQKKLDDSILNRNGVRNPNPPSGHEDDQWLKVPSSTYKELVESGYWKEPTTAQKIESGRQSAAPAAAAPAAPAAAPPSAAAVPDVVSTLQQLEPVKNVPVSTLRLRTAYSGLSKEAFDQLMLKERAAQRVFLSEHADPYNLSQADRDMLIYDPVRNTYYVAVSTR